MNFIYSGGNHKFSWEIKNKNYFEIQTHFLKVKGKFLKIKITKIVPIQG